MAGFVRMAPPGDAIAASTFAAPSDACTCQLLASLPLAEPEPVSGGSA
jgi:hypothetical protein